MSLNVDILNCISLPELMDAKQDVGGNMSHVCTLCGKSFTRKDNLSRHIRNHSAEKKFVCELCSKAFSRSSDLIRHMIIHNKEELFKCSRCQEKFNSLEELNKHIPSHKVGIKRKHPASNPVKRRKDDKTALNVFSTSNISPTSETYDLNGFLQEVKHQIIDRLNEEFQDKESLKWYTSIQVHLSRRNQDGTEDSTSPFFRSKCMIDLMSETISIHVDEALGKMIASFEEFVQRGSGWVIQSVGQLEIHTAKYRPLAASSFISLPEKIVLKKAVLNIQNKDHKCLIWCLLAHKLNIHRKNNPYRVLHYLSHEKEIALGNVTCPVPLTKISIIEKLNNLRINVFGFENEVFPLYISNRTDDDVINLLLISNETNLHYCLIKNMSRLLGDLTKYHPTSSYCFRCLHRFCRKDLLKKHLEYCGNHMPQRIKLPEENEKWISFTNVHYQHSVPYIIYADFEAMIVPISSCSQNENVSSTELTASHDACGYAYVIVDENGKSLKPIEVYRGPNAINHFLKSILLEKEELVEKLIEIKPLHMTSENEIEFQNAKWCSICRKELGESRVRDHCHLSGLFRGAAHQNCNLKYKLCKKIPVVFHNLKKYDSHLIMQGLGQLKDYNINVLASNMENYISFSLSKMYTGVWISLQFIDSFQFLSTSLGKLVENLPAEKFYILRENMSHIHLLLRKGVYPYDYVNSFEKFDEKSLPPPAAFYNKLTDEEISSEDYAHAETIWKTFDIKNLGQYHDLYVKLDVLQLADVFENFRKLCKTFYGLDCAHLLTSPGLAWQACLKMTEQPLELFTDINMHLFVEEGIRGGISMITKRLAEANNKYMKTYDSSKPDKYIMYMDANNLYGWAMSQPLPYGNFKWIDSTEDIVQYILSRPEDTSEGFILEVDLEYPNHLHDSHNDYPLAPEKVKINEEHLSPYARSLVRNTFIPSTKLVPNLNNKCKYITYHRNLQLYLSLGLKLLKVHRILKFDQKPWLKSYINFNTEERKKAKSPFEKDIFKLLNNAVYGKTMENVRNHIDVQLVNSQKRSEKLVAAPTFKSFKIFDNELVGVERIKECVTLNKPIHVGFTILELSKLHMYKFHYNHIKQIYGDRARLLFTDTDSLTYEIQTPDVYQDMKLHAHLFDTSDYPQDHPSYSIENKKKLGCFKDEMSSKPILEFVGLRSKMYSILSEEGEKKTLKGICRRVVQKKLTHSDYKDCLLKQSYKKEKQIQFHTEKHHIYTTQQTKLALTPFDDKRYLLDDGVQSYSYGHYKICQQ